MASSVKIALMFALMAIMAMATQAGSHNVSCTNNYCKPITVNGVVIGVGLTLDILIDNGLGILVCEVENILGKVVVGSCNCPSQVTSVVILEVGGDLVVEVTTSMMPSPLDSILCKLILDVAVCL